MGDIALPNINYETQWQQQKSNKTFQQELEQLKQEVHYEGLQVEEEGLTDIIRKKTKLPPESTNPNEPSKNDAILVVSMIVSFSCFFSFLFLFFFSNNIRIIYVFDRK